MLRGKPSAVADRPSIAPAAGHSATALSMQCSSSRMLPGHRWARSRRNASSLMPRTALLWRVAYCLTKCCASRSMSSPPVRAVQASTARSLSAGNTDRPETAPIRPALRVVGWWQRRSEHRPRAFSPAHALELAILQKPQQLALQTAFQIANLIEKQRSPSASSALPNTRCSAPVNAPRSCPNSSDSISPSGIDVQSILTNAPLPAASCSESRVQRALCRSPIPRESAPSLSSLRRAQ